MSELQYKTAPAKSGNADSLIIFLHGYGADGADLLSLSTPLSQHLPNTAFAAPDAPDRSTMNPMGFEWFPIPWIDGSSEEEAKEGLLSSSAMLNDWLVRIGREFNLSSERIVLIGFSQGTMMALHVGPRSESKFAGIVGFSGRLLEPEALANEVKSRPPILLIHGDMDDVVPASSMPQAAEALDKAGFKVGTYVAEGTAHGISPDGLSVALGFIHDLLN